MAEHTIPQRQLRNECSDVLRQVGEGHTFIVTTDGKPVARIVPVDTPRFTRKKPPGWTRNIKAVVHEGETIQEALDYLRGER